MDIHTGLLDVFKREGCRLNDIQRLVNTLCGQHSGHLTDGVGNIFKYISDFKLSLLL
jgi:hypothetical protein